MTRAGIRKVVVVSAACLAAIGTMSAISEPGATPIQPNCAETPSGALQQVHKALDRHDTSSDREALICIVAAVAALDARLRGLSDGSIPFDGQIHIPKGWVMSKPPTEEAR